MRDPEYIELINCQQWRDVRNAKMVEAKHLCENCLREGKMKPATEVHHIHPVGDALSFEEKKRLCYDPNNLICLCHECHEQIHREMGQRTKKYKKHLAESRAESFINRLFK